MRSHKQNSAQRNAALGIIAFTVIALAAYFIFKEVSRKKENQLYSQFAEIDEVYQNKRSEFKDSVTEEAQAKERAAVTPEMKKFEEFARQNPAAPISWFAASRVMSFYIDSKKWNEALDIANVILPFIKEKNLIFLRMALNKATLLADQKKYTESLVVLDELIKAQDNPVIQETKLLKAKILYLNNQKDETKKLLGEVVGKTPTRGPFSSLSGDKAAYEAELLLSYWQL